MRMSRSLAIAHWGNLSLLQRGRGWLFTHNTQIWLFTHNTKMLAFYIQHLNINYLHTTLKYDILTGYLHTTLKYGIVIGYLHTTLKCGGWIFTHHTQKLKLDIYTPHRNEEAGYLHLPLRLD